MSDAQDRREQILTRLQEVVAGVSPIVKCHRNRSELPENHRPGAVILDGDETMVEDMQVGRGRSALVPPQVIDMTPEIFIALAGGETEVGTALNQLRFDLIKAIMNDDKLIRLCLDGGIRYVAFSSEFANGRSLEAEGHLGFAFRYVLHP